jgi:hypothetical protein
MSDMLQVPGNGTVSLPPSQTSTVVVNMSSEEPNSSDDVRSTHNSVVEMDASAERDPEPQVLLTFLLLSGRRKTYAFEQDCSIAVVKERLVCEWPSGKPSFPSATTLLLIRYVFHLISSEWEDEMRPQTVSQIRLLHYGRQLLDNETLSASMFEFITNDIIYTNNMRRIPISTSSCAAYPRSCVYQTPCSQNSVCN